MGRGIRRVFCEPPRSLRPSVVGSLSSLSLDGVFSFLLFRFPLPRLVCPPPSPPPPPPNTRLAPAPQSVTDGYYFRDNDEAQHMSLGGSHHLSRPTM